MELICWFDSSLDDGKDCWVMMETRHGFCWLQVVDGSFEIGRGDV